MNYVKSLNLFGVEAKEIPCITGSGAPTTTTVGAVGLLYMNTNNGDVYKCTAVSGSTYTWAPMENASSDSGGNADQSGLSAEASALLITILRNGVYSNDQSENITALESALASGGSEEEPDEPVTPEKTLSSIAATYSGGDVAVGTAVTTLTGIVVTAHYSDGTSVTVTGYTLSGTIAEGSNTVTVNYQGKTTTFTVTGVAESEPEIPSVEIPADATRLAYIESTGTQYIDTGYQPSAKDTIEMTMETDYIGDKAIEWWFGASDGTNNLHCSQNWSYIEWGRTGNNQKISAPKASVVFGDSANPVKVTVRTVFAYSVYLEKNVANLELSANGTEVQGAGTAVADMAVYNDIAANMYLFSYNKNGSVQTPGAFKLYECIFYAADGTEKHHYVPVKDASDVVCLYDTVAKQYLYNAGTGDFVGGEAA